MRFLLVPLLFSLAAFSQQVVSTHSTESFRGVSAVSRQVAWASGTHGTYLRTTDGGRIWTPEKVPGADNLDFRGVVAFSADEAFLLSAGPGDQSRIYHTADAGRHWQLQYTSKNPKSFFDSMAFWDRTHGVVLGDPVPDESGQMKFELLTTDDGDTWARVPQAQLPSALEGEGAFAASNSCIALLRSDLASNRDIWFATGGKAARVFHSADRGGTWEVFDTPINHGLDSTGIFSIAFRDSLHGVIAGGDYKHPDVDGPNLAFTSDGGRTWKLAGFVPQYYYSAVAFDRKYDDPRAHSPKFKDKNENQLGARLFIVGPQFIYDFRPPRNPERISSRKKSGAQFNAVSPFPDGGALVAGPKGTIAILP